MIRLLVIEDNASIIVAGLRNMFRPERDDIRIAVVAESADEALQKVTPDDFDLIILDLWLSRSLPMDNFRKLKTAFPGKPVLIYTQDDSPVWQTKMQLAGAGAYVTKNTPRDELKRAILKVSTGGTWFTGPLQEKDLPAMDVMSERPSVSLSPVQRRMAELLAHGAGRREIARAMSTHPSAVDKTFAKLRQQFRCNNNYELIRVLTDNAML